MVLRARRGILVTEDRNDAMTVSSSAENVIVDHFSVGFGTDENFSMPGDEGQGPRNFTLQWSINAWGLQRNNHSAGSLLTSNQTTIHHCLWAFNKTRNPRGRSEEAATRGQGGHLDWVNNVIYGWNSPDPVGEAAGWSISHDPFILAGTSNGMHAANAVGNYFISRRSASYAFHNGTSNFRLFPSNNILDGNANGMLDSSKTGNDMIEGSPTILAARIASPQVTTDAPRAAYDRVIAGVGASVPMRDQADALLISQGSGSDGQSHPIRAGPREPRRRRLGLRHARRRDAPLGVRQRSRRHAKRLGNLEQLEPERRRRQERRHRWRRLHEPRRVSELARSIAETLGSSP